MEEMTKIPKSFDLFATTISVVWDNEGLNLRGHFGEFSYTKAQIALSTTEGVENLSKDRIMDTFYHEKVHSILDTMNEQELSVNEKFVDVFAKLLRQSDETAKY